MERDILRNNSGEQTTADSWWSNVHLIEDGPIIVAAKLLADRGFRITVQPAEADGKPLSHEYAAIHVQTPSDRAALGALMGTDEMRTLRAGAKAMYSTHYLPLGLLLPTTPNGPLSEEAIGPHLAGAIERLGLKPERIERVIEQKKLKPKGIEGYDGPPFTDIPEGLRERVQTAAEAAKKGKGMGLVFFEVKTPQGQMPEWGYGKYTDVYVFDNDHFHNSYHRINDRQFRTFLTGSGESDHIAKALGFDRGQAEIIPDKGWVHRRSEVDELTRQGTPMGPYYGQINRQPVSNVA